MFQACPTGPTHHRLPTGIHSGSRKHGKTRNSLKKCPFASKCLNFKPSTLSTTIMEVENGCSLKMTTIGRTHVALNHDSGRMGIYFSSNFPQHKPPKTNMEFKTILRLKRKILWTIQIHFLCIHAWKNFQGVLFFNQQKKSGQFIIDP